MLADVFRYLVRVALALPPIAYEAWGIWRREIWTSANEDDSGVRWVGVDVVRGGLGYIALGVVTGAFFPFVLFV